MEHKIEITKDIRRYTIQPDFLGCGEMVETYYDVSLYANGEKIVSETTKSIKEAGTIAQSYETFLKYYKQN